MATIQLTLTDTPTGGVAIHSSYKPAIGLPCSPAQGHALELLNRTHKQWGQEKAAAVCHCSRDLTSSEIDLGRCETCGKAVLE